MKIDHMIDATYHPVEHRAVNVFVKPSNVFHIYGVTWRTKDEFDCVCIATLHSVDATNKYISNLLVQKNHPFHSLYFEEAIDKVSN
jgi:hypothetical protein